jgi:hypothetical protein
MSSVEAQIRIRMKDFGNRIFHHYRYIFVTAGCV